MNETVSKTDPMCWCAAPSPGCPLTGMSPHHSRASAPIPVPCGAAQPGEPGRVGGCSPACLLTGFHPRVCLCFAPFALFKNWKTSGVQTGSLGFLVCFSPSPCPQVPNYTVMWQPAALGAPGRLSQLWCALGWRAHPSALPSKEPRPRHAGASFKPGTLGIGRQKLRQHEPPLLLTHLQLECCQNLSWFDQFT